LTYNHSIIDDVSTIGKACNNDIDMQPFVVVDTVDGDEKENVF
jgi:hypothetical protein